MYRYIPSSKIQCVKHFSSDGGNDEETKYWIHKAASKVSKGSFQKIKRRNIWNFPYVG